MAKTVSETQGGLAATSPATNPGVKTCFCMPHGVPHTSYRSYVRTVGTDCSLGLRSGIRCNSAPRPCTLARGLTRQGLDRTRRQKAAPLPPDGSASGPDVLTRSSFRRTLGPEPRRQGSKSNPAHDSGRVRSNQGGLCRQKYSHKHTASSIQNNPQKLRDPVPNRWVSVSTPYPCVAGRGEKLDPHTNFFFGRLPFRETDPPEQVGLRQGGSSTRSASATACTASAFAFAFALAALAPCFGATLAAALAFGCGFGAC